MKKTIAMILALVLTLGLFAGCGSVNTGDGKDYASMSLDALKGEITTVTKGVLTVATSPDFAPYEFYSLDDAGHPTLAGFDMALAQYIADYLGLKLEVIPMDFDGTIAELAGKKVDIGMAGYSPDPKRADKMDFSEVYYTGGQSFVTVKSKAGLFTTIEDTNKAEYTIGAQLGSIQVGLAQTNSPDADLVQLGKVTDLIAELLSGHMDGAYIEKDVALSYAENYPDLAVVLDVPYDAEGSVVGVSKGNGPLMAAINLAIKSALEDGSMSKFIEEAQALASGSTYEGLLEDME